MQMPPEGSSSETLLAYGDFHVAGLGADRSTSETGRAFLSVQTALRTAREAREGAERAEIGAEALRVAAEVAVESALRRIELMLLSSVNKKRDRDPYARVLPSGLEGVLRPKGAAQAVEAHRVADLVSPRDRATALDGVPGEAVSAGAELRDLSTQLTTAAEAENAASLATATALANEHQAKRRWREQYRKNHGLLTALYPSDSRRVEAFFKKGGKSKRGAPPEPTPPA